MGQNTKSFALNCEYFQTNFATRSRCEPIDITLPRSRGALPLLAASKAVIAEVEESNFNHEVLYLEVRLAVAGQLYTSTEGLQLWITSIMITILAAVGSCYVVNEFPGLDKIS